MMEQLQQRRQQEKSNTTPNKIMSKNNNTDNGEVKLHYRILECSSEDPKHPVSQLEEKHHVLHDSVASSISTSRLVHI